LAQTGFDLGLARLTAPGPGVILARPAEPGQIVSPGQQVLLLGDMAGGLVLRLPVADRDAARLKRGQAAAVLLPALPGPALNGIISEIGARGDDGSGTFRVEIRLPADPRLKSGLIGTAKLALAGQSGPLKVPTTAVFAARADEGFVYVLADGKAQQRLVGLGPVDDAGTVITRGLSAGEQVITTGIDRLRPGMAVQIVAASR
jgi:RND family efflux transporter MFP subunit